MTGEKKAVIHRRGTFVFRLAGRERQQSASYYTPEVLTRFTVSQALEELLDQDGHTTTAEEILGLTVCEPALGSGAFAIEAVRQLAEQYLRRRQAELGKRIDPDEVPDRTAAGQGIDRPAPGLRRGPQRDRRRTRRDLALAGHDGVRAAGPVVRPAAAARQLPDRRAARRVHAGAGQRQVLAEGDAGRRADDRHGRGDGRRRRPPSRPTAASTTSCSPRAAGARRSR